MVRAGLVAAGTRVSPSPPWSPSGPSRGSATSGLVVHSAPAGHWRLPLPSLRTVLQPGVYMAVLPATIVFTSVRPSPKIAPAIWSGAVEWLFAIVQFRSVPVGV